MADDLSSRWRSRATRVGGLTVLRRLPLLWLGITGVVATLVIVAVGTTGQAASRTVNTVGTVWLSSFPQGRLVQVNASTGDVVTSVPVFAEGTEFRTFQQGANGLAVKLPSGEAVRVSGTTLAAGSHSPPVPNSDVKLVTADEHRAFLVAGSQVTVLASAGNDFVRSGPFASPGAIDDIAVDEDGVLWMLDAGAGTLTPLVDGVVGRVRPLGRLGRDAALARAGDRVVVVSQDPAGLAAIDTDGRPAQLCADELHDVAGLEAGSADEHASSVTVLAPTSAKLVRADFRSGRCRQVPLPPPGPTVQLGPPASSGSITFVPNYATGSVFKVDWSAPTGRTDEITGVAPPGSHFDLVAKDQFIVLNDPRGSSAEALAPRRQVISKATGAGDVRSQGAHPPDTTIPKTPTAPQNPSTSSTATAPVPVPPTIPPANRPIPASASVPGPRTDGSSATPLTPTAPADGSNQSSGPTSPTPTTAGATTTNGTQPNPVGAPAITAQASPTEVDCSANPTPSVSLTWTTTDATKVDVGVDHSNSVGSFTAGLPPARLAPGENVPFACSEAQHTYFLRATGPAGSKETSIVVGKRAPGQLSGTLLANGADPGGSLSLRATQGVTLSWQPTSPGVNASAVAVVWDLGAGPRPAVPATQAQALVLTTPGEYTVSATASAPNFQSTTVALTVDVTTTVTMQICNSAGATCSSSPAARSGEKIGIDVSVVFNWSSPGDAVPMDLFVDWGDGTSAQSSVASSGSQALSHRFAGAGSYAVTATGRGDRVNEGSATQAIGVLRRAGALTCVPGGIILDCFVAVPSDAEQPVSWSWQLLDGRGGAPLLPPPRDMARTGHVRITLGFMNNGVFPGQPVPVSTVATAHYASGDAISFIATYEAMSCLCGTVIQDV